METFKKCSSSSLAYQLTMLDNQLYLQLSTLELGRLRKDRSSWRAPHWRALLLFSHRVSCLVASQVLYGSDIKERSLRVVKCIGVAYKCHKMRSLQSAMSVLRGLQSPPVYRLHSTWGYVRRHYGSKFRRFEDLSKRYQDPRLPLYQRTFDTLTRSAPYLPCAELLVAGLLRRVPELPKVSSSVSCVLSDCVVSNSKKNHLQNHRCMLTENCPPLEKHADICNSVTHSASESDVRLEDLDQYFAPVASDSPARRLLQDLDYFLEASQAASALYSCPAHQGVREMLLWGPYETLPRLFTSSRQLEPCPD